MGIFSRFTKKKELNGTNQEKELSSAESSPRRRPSSEGKLSALSKQSDPVAAGHEVDADISKSDAEISRPAVTMSKTSADISKAGSASKGADIVNGAGFQNRVPEVVLHTPGRIILVNIDNESELAATPTSVVGPEHSEGDRASDAERRVSGRTINGHGVQDGPLFQDGPSFQDSGYSGYGEPHEERAESESDSSGEEGGSEREEFEREESERDENESEGVVEDEGRFGSEGRRFREEEPDFYGLKEEAVENGGEYHLEIEGGYRSEGGQTPEPGHEETFHYHSEGVHRPELSETEKNRPDLDGHHEVTSPEEGPPSREGGSGETPWTNTEEMGARDLPKSDNEALGLVAAWEKEKGKKKPWWKVFGPGHHKEGVESQENLTPRSGGSDSEIRSGRNMSPLSDSAALNRKEVSFQFRGRKLGEEKQSEGSERSRSPLWFFRQKRGGEMGSPTSPPPKGAALELSSPRASNGSPMIRESSPVPVTEPANHEAPPVAPKSEEGSTALLRREHLRAVPERREMSWVKEWVSRVDPAEAPSDIELEIDTPEEPSSPPSWEGNLLLGPDPPELTLSSRALEPEAPKPAANADIVFANAVASEVDLRSTSAYLGGRGLKLVPPSLSIFGALKTLDLSRNAIAHIPSGVLPRGLHHLNLSLNKLTAVEGLRELTRLRSLNLHANRIVRIGHGLATCQSLKELHLSANKIGEVEGLHRLLKLQVLDLSDNKLTSTKSLGQLAANYSSLQALNLIGNPVLASVGSDQLRRFIVGLVPQVMYLNKQTLKTLSGRDAAVERAVLGSKGHSSSRGGSKREKAHGKASPVRRGRASTGSVAGPSSKRTSLGRSKSSSRLAGAPPVSHHHHHHHRSSSQHRHHHSSSGTRHNAHSIPREARPIDVGNEVRPPQVMVSSPSKPPRPPSGIALQTEVPSSAGAFEFSIPKVASESAIETPRHLVKQISGEF